MVDLPSRSGGLSPRSRRGLRIPDADSSVRSVAAPRDPGVQVPNGAFGGGIGDAAAGAADALSSVGASFERQQKQADATATTEAMISFESEAREEFRKRQVEGDPASPEFMNEYQNWIGVKRLDAGGFEVSGKLDEALRSLPDTVSDDARERLRLRLIQSSVGMVDSAGLVQLKAGAKAADDAYTRLVSGYSAQVTENPDALDDLLGLAEEDVGEFAGVWSADRERDATADAKQALIVSAVDGYMEQDRFDEARAVLANDEFSDDLTPAARGRAGKAIDRAEKVHEREVELANAEQDAKAASDLEIGIRRGEMSHEDVEEAFEVGSISAAKRTQLTLAADTVADEIKKQGDANLFVHRALAGVINPDPRNKDHRKTIDQGFDDLAANQWSDLPANQQLDNYVLFAEKTGVVPKALQGSIRGAIRSGSTEQKLFNTDLLSRLTEANPALTAEFSAKDVSVATLTTQYIRAGAEPKKALESAETAVHGADDGTRKLRMTEARESSSFTSPDSALKSALDPQTPVIGLAVSDADIPEAARIDYRLQYERFYTETGDEDAAENLAMSAVKRIWARTSVDGSARLMRYAPEAVYGAGDNDWMAPQFKEDMLATGLVPESGLETLRIQVDPRTAREYNPATGRAAPSYAVLQKLPDGRWDVLTTDEGVPVRWRPDFSATEDAGKEVRDARGKRDFLIRKQKHDALQVDSLRRQANPEPD